MRRAAYLSAVVLIAAGCGAPPPSAHVDFATIDATPAWSPDGRLIAFASSRNGGGIYVVHPDGTGMRRVVKAAASDPAWSPDGRSLAYSGVGGIYLVGRDGSHGRRLLHGPYSLPAWSRDGRLAVVRRTGAIVTEIDLVDRNGARLRGVRPHLARSDPAWNPVDAGETEPSWSPEGSRLVVEAGNQTILVCTIADGRYRRLVEKQGVEPSWSPDGKLIAFQTEQALWVANADGSGLRRFAGRSASNEAVAAEGSHPAWAPDSRRVVFEVAHDRGHYNRRAYTLSVVDIDTGDLTKLTYDRSTADDPAWRDAVVGKTTF